MENKNPALVPVPLVRTDTNVFLMKCEKEKNDEIIKKNTRISFVSPFQFVIFRSVTSLVLLYVIIFSLCNIGPFPPNEVK